VPTDELVGFVDKLLDDLEDNSDGCVKMDETATETKKDETEAGEDNEGKCDSPGL
jgi:hypothetical protein